MTFQPYMYNLPLHRLDDVSALFSSTDKTILLTIPREHWEANGRPTEVSFSPLSREQSLRRAGITP